MKYLNLDNGFDEIIIVDNDSTDFSIDSVADNPKAKCIRLQENKGYGGGCNVGFMRANGDVLLFMNPDVTLLTPVELARESLEQNPNCAVVAPGIIEQNELCNTLRPFPSVLREIPQELGMASPATCWKNFSESSGPERTFLFSDCYAQGSILFVRRDAFERIGGFDEAFFLYLEEVDLFRRLVDAGFVFLYDSRCLVKHRSGGSSNSLDWRKTAIRLNSRLLYYTKHVSISKLATYRAMIILVLLVKIVVCLPGVLLRFMNPRKIRAYLYALDIYLRGHRPWHP